MNKMTVVRQNHCDRQMDFLFFCSYFFYFALLTIGNQNTYAGFANKLVLFSYLISVSGFFLVLGYRYAARLRADGSEQVKRWLLLLAVKYLIFYMLLTMAYELMLLIPEYGVSAELGLLLPLVSDLFGLMLTTPVSAVFFTLALVCLAAWVLNDRLQGLLEKPRLLFAVILLLLLSAMLRTEQESYMLVASVVGSEQSHALAGLPYFAFFLLGCVLEEKKPGFQWRLAACAAAVTGVSILLYGTPVRDLCRVTIVALPVYVIYVLAEVLYDLSLRFPVLKTVVSGTEVSFAIYAALALCLGAARVFAASGLRVIVPVALVLAIAAYLTVPAFRLFCSLYARFRDWFQYRVRHKTAVYFALFTAGFAFVLFLVFFDFLVRGKTLIVKGDGISQYYPRIIYFSRYIRELISNFLSGNFSLPMYDFSIGLGTEITYSLEPLYFLYVLFKEEHLELAYSLVTVLRFYCAGVSMSVLCLYFKKDYFPTFLASVVYVVSGFALYGCVMHPMFMIPMIMLPLLILSMEEILRHRRWYLCTIFVAVSLLSNYYYLYMNTIAMGIYFVVRFCCQKKKEERTFKKFVGRGLVISGSYLLGVAMSCIVLVTTFGMYLGSGRGSASVIKTPSFFFYRPGWLVDCFETFLTMANSPGEWLKLGYLPIALIAVIVLFARKGKKELKIFSVLCVIFMAFPLFGYIFSGFSAVINRWCYMITLVVAYLVADRYEDMMALQRREKLAIVVVMLIYSFQAFLGTHKNTGFTQVASVTLLATYLVVLASQKDRKQISEAVKRCLMLVLTFALVFYSGLSIFELGGRVKGYADHGQSDRNELDTPLAALPELEDESFYRASALKLDYYTSNAPFLLDYNSTTMICSTLNGNLMELLEKNGCISYSITQMLGFSNRGFLNELAAVKYLGGYEDYKRTVPYGYTQVLDTEVNGQGAKLYENQYALPLGYTYDSVMTEEELESHEVLQRQEIMMQRAVISDGELAEKYSAAEAPEVTAQRLEIKGTSENGVRLTEGALIAGKGDEDSIAEGKYSIKLKFRSLPKSELYLVLHNAYLEGDMSENPIGLKLKTEGNVVSYSFKPDDYRYHTGQKDFVFNLGYYEDPVSYLKLIMGREGVIHFDSLEVYSQPMENTGKYTDSLTETVLENVEIGENVVSGTVSLDEDKLLVLSIPYQNGWTAYVDGEKAKLYRANYAYMALDMEPGEHTVELRFEIPGVYYALKIMLGASLLFVLLCIATWLYNRKKRGRK